MPEKIAAQAMKSASYQVILPLPQSCAIFKRGDEEIMLPNTIQLISQAIKEKRCIAIRYHDQRQIRVVEPHAVYTDERGELSMDAGIPPPAGRRRSGGLSV